MVNTTNEQHKACSFMGWYKRELKLIKNVAPYAFKLNNVGKIKIIALVIQPVIKPDETAFGTDKIVLLWIFVFDNKMVINEERKSKDTKVSIFPPKVTLINATVTIFVIVAPKIIGYLIFEKRNIKVIMSAPKRVKYPPYPKIIPRIKIIGR